MGSQIYLLFPLKPVEIRLDSIGFKEFIHNMLLMFFGDFMVAKNIGTDFSLYMVNANHEIYEAVFVIERQSAIRPI
jgi:hypothetical protein